MMRTPESAKKMLTKINRTASPYHEFPIQVVANEGYVDSHIESYKAVSILMLSQSKKPPCVVETYLWRK